MISAAFWKKKVSAYLVIKYNLNLRKRDDDAICQQLAKEYVVQVPLQCSVSTEYANNIIVSFKFVCSELARKPCGTLITVMCAAPIRHTIKTMN